PSRTAAAVKYRALLGQGDAE
ncbi:hypothetical protein ACV345_33195, partial [Pseudomonas aeruginosa]